MAQAGAHADAQERGRSNVVAGVRIATGLIQGVILYLLSGLPGRRHRHRDTAQQQPPTAQAVTGSR